MTRNVAHRILLLLVVASQFTATAALPGGWTQPQGVAFLKADSRMLRGDDFHELNGNGVQIPTLTDYTASLYGEYGLRDNVTFLGYVPFKRITLNRQVGRPSGFVYFDGDSETGLGDAQIGLRYRLLQRGASVASLEVQLGLPLGNETQGNGLLTGDGEINQSVHVQLGHLFYPRRGYAGISLGFNNRVDGYSDEWHYAAEIGWSVGARWQLMLQVRGLESLENGDSAVTGGMGGLFANDQTLWAYGPTVSCRLGDYWLSLGVEHSARARNAIAAPAISLAVATVIGKASN